MAFFGKKKSSGTGAGGFAAQPEKAARWIDQGKHIADTGNHTYALTCFASAIKLDPGNMDTHALMYAAAAGHHSKEGAPATRKELKDIDGSSPVDKFAAAELAWMRDVNSVPLAMKLLDAAVKADQLGFGQWLAPKLLNMIKNLRKPSKSDFIKAKTLFAAAQAWDEAFSAGEQAVKLDPTDAALMQELKQLTAQKAIISGGYSEATSGDGSFRDAVKDMDRQQQLEDESSMIGGSSDERAVVTAREELEADMSSPEAVTKLAKTLLRKNTPEATEEAFDVFMAAFERLSQYRFKMLAGDIRLNQSRARVNELAKRVNEEPDDETLCDRLNNARTELTALKGTEYAERAKKYPTDRSIKFELGNVLLDQGDYEAAMGNFQECKDEPKFRMRSAHRLGKCFAEERWFPEAVAEYRDALESIDATNRDLELPIKYDLMVSLIALAKDTRSREIAEEASEICSSIVRKDIRYRDIKEKKREVEELRRSLA